MDAALTASPLQLAAASSSSSGAEPRAIEGEAADAFSEGLMGLLTPLVHKCDEGVQAALDSQAALSQQIDRVTTALAPARAPLHTSTHHPNLPPHHTAQRLHPMAPSPSPPPPSPPHPLPRQVAAELQTFLGSSQIPSFAPHAQKLQTVRRRIAATNGTPQQVQARLARLDRLAERLQAREHNTLRQLPVP